MLRIRMQSPALEGVELSLRPGEVHAVIGLGSGDREEFIRGLAGQCEVTGGVSWGGPETGFGLRPLEMQGIEVILEEPLLIRHLSVADNVSFGRYPYAVWPIIRRQAVRERCLEVLGLIRLSIDPQTKVADLTPEARKLLYVGRALARRPRAILMCEPTRHLSRLAVEQLDRLIGDFRRQGGSVLYISRQWERVLRIADRMSVLANGRIVGTQHAREVQEDPKRFMNLLLGGEVNGEDSDSAEESIKLLDGVFKAAEFLISRSELKDVLQLLADYACDLMKADGCTINLMAEPTKEVLDSVQCVRTDSRLEAKMRTDVVRQILADDTIFYATEREEDFPGLFSSLHGVRAVICVPVFIRSQVTGFIQVFYRNYYIYSEREAKYLNAIARQVAVAIENTRLMGRSALLQESHHRIKNNLQYIVSLIVLQKQFIRQDSERSVESILDSIVARVKSIAAVHELLSHDQLGRSIINVKDITAVVVDFFRSAPVTIDVDLEDIHIPYEQASAVSLIVNELVNNAVSHAFGDDGKGTIRIHCRRRGRSIHLCVADNGQGFPQAVLDGGFSSLGLSIMQAIVVNQFGGTLTLSNAGGARVEVVLP